MLYVLALYLDTYLFYPNQLTKMTEAISSPITNLNAKCFVQVLWNLDSQPYGHSSATPTGTAHRQQTKTRGANG